MTTIQPLISADFNLYDTTPDGRLFLGDFARDGHFDEELFTDFVLRYIHTDDQSVRATFRGSMKYPLWKKVQKRIQKIAKEKSDDKTLRERLDTILNIEFPDRKIGGGFFTEYNLDKTEETQEGMSSYHVQKTTHTSKTGGSIGFEYPFRRWLYSLNGSASGTVNRQNQIQRAGDQTLTEDSQFYGSSLYAGTGLRTREDDSMNLNFSSNTTRFFNPPSDHERVSTNLSGSGEIRDLQLAGKPLSARADLNYYTKSYTSPPQASGFYEKKNDSKSLDTELTYQFSKLGLVMNGAASLSDYSEHYSIGDSFHWGVDTLLQYTMGPSYVRGGVGYGTTKGKYLSYRNDEPVIYQEKEVNGKVNTKLRIKKEWSLNASASAQGNDSEGTFMGWYPSWSADVTLLHAPRSWTNSVSVNYGGSYIDLNEFQQSNSLSSSLNLIYRPSDRLKFNFSPGASFSKTEGFHASESKSANVSGGFDFNPSFWKRLWIGPNGGASVSRFKDDMGNRIDTQGWSLNGTLSLNL